MQDGFVEEGDLEVVFGGPYQSSPVACSTLIYNMSWSYCFQPVCQPPLLTLTEA